MIFARQNAELLLETAREVLGCGEAYLAGNIGNSGLGRLNEQQGCLLQTNVPHEVCGRLSRLFLHSTIERDAAHAHVTAQLLNAIVGTTQVLLD